MVSIIPAMPGQRQCCAHKAQCAEHQEQVHQYGYGRENAEQAVGQNHEDDNRNQTDNRGGNAFADRIRTQTCADGSFFQNLKRGGQGARTKQQSQVIGRFQRKVAGDDAAAAGNGALNDRGRNDLVIQYDGQSFADVVFGCLAEFFAADGVEFKTDNRLSFLKSSLGVNQIFTADDRFAADDISFAAFALDQAG